MNSLPDDTQLIQAAENGDQALLQTWLDRQPGLLLRWRSQDGDMLLHLACWQKQLALASWLLAEGAEVNARGWLSRTPLHYAVHEGNDSSAPLVRLLLQHGASREAQDALGRTAADWARIDMHGEAQRSVLTELGEPLTGLRP